MNKNVAGILSAAAVLTMLAGCTAYDRTKDQFTQPVVKDVKKGMTRSQVAAIAGKPSSEVTMIHAKGTCQTYILGQRDGKAETYFVALDDTGHVINSGYRPVLNTTPIRRHLRRSNPACLRMLTNRPMGRFFYASENLISLRELFARNVKGVNKSGQ